MVLDFLSGLLLTLLPQRYRQRWLAEWQGSLRRGAVASSIAQILVTLSALIFRYPRFVAGQIAAIDSRAFVAAAEHGGDTTVRGFGIILLFAYLLTPLSLLLIYFAIEGAVRFTAAVSTGEVIGTLPLLLLEKSEQLLKDWREERRQGPRIPDELSPAPVEGIGYDLAIASCRVKPNWNESMTVSYQGSLYEIADYLEAAPPRRHVYLLRRAPEHKVVRGLHHYDPEEILKN